MRELFCNEIEFICDLNALLERLHCEDVESELFIRAIELLEEARPLLKPAFAVRELPVGLANEKGITVGNRFFNSKIVAHKLKNETSAFSYIATCGCKISTFIENTEDALDQYILDQIAYLAYLQAMNQMTLEAENQLGIKRQIRLCPGSIIDWSVGEVKKIFDLMEGLYQHLDVNILSSGLINPLKSTSGLFYASDEEFESCAVCPRAICETRQMTFNEELHDRMVNL